MAIAVGIVVYVALLGLTLAFFYGAKIARGDDD